MCILLTNSFSLKASIFCKTFLSIDLEHLKTISWSRWQHSNPHFKLPRPLIHGHECAGNNMLSGVQKDVTKVTEGYSSLISSVTMSWWKCVKVLHTPIFCYWLYSLQNLPHWRHRDVQKWVHPILSCHTSRSRILSRAFCPFWDILTMWTSPTFLAQFPGVKIGSFRNV